LTQKARGALEGRVVVESWTEQAEAHAAGNTLP
jgi:hypothetical protein